MADLLNPLTQIAGPESSFGTDLQNPTSSASGIYGMLDSTWQANLRAIGGDPAQYPSAKLAPNNLQSAVAAHLYNARGFADYTCPNCDAVLTRQVAEHGGEAAYQPRGSLSENPADYASQNTPAGLQAWFNSNPGGSFVGAATMQNTPAALEAFAAANAAPTAKPFSYAYTLIVENAAPAVGDNVRKVQDLAFPWLTAAIMLAVAIAAIPMILGRSRIENFYERAIRIALVSAFAIPGSAFYATYVQAIVTALPATISAAFGMANAGPMGVFDDTSNVLFVISETIFGETPFTFSGAGVVLLTGLTFFAGQVALWVLALPYIATAFLLLLALVFGPIAIVAALFRSLDRWLLGFVDQIATLAAQILAIDVVISLYQKALVALLQGYASVGNPDADFRNFLGAVGIIAVMAFTVYRYLHRMVARIFGGGASIALGGGGRAIFGFATR